MSFQVLKPLYIQGALHSTEKFTGLLGEFMVHSEESPTPPHRDTSGSISVTPAGFARLLLPVVAYLGVLDKVPCSWYVPLQSLITQQYVAC